MEKHSAVLDIEHVDQIPVDADHEGLASFSYEKPFKRVRRMIRTGRNSVWTVQVGRLNLVWYSLSRWWVMTRFCTSKCFYCRILPQILRYPLSSELFLHRPRRAVTFRNPKGFSQAKEIYDLWLGGFRKNSNLPEVCSRLPWKVLALHSVNRPIC